MKSVNVNKLAERRSRIARDVLHEREDHGRSVLR